MREWIFGHWEHVLCGLIVVARIGDIGTTLLASPRLRLEANPLVRRWPRFVALASFATALLPYYHTGLAFAALVLFLLVCAHNASGIWLARGLGEEDLARLMRRGAQNVAPAWIFHSFALRAFFWMCIACLFVLLGQGDAGLDWIGYAGIGILLFVLGSTVHTLLAIRRMRRAPADPAVLSA